jgi:hypothetical protein
MREMLIRSGFFRVTVGSWGNRDCLIANQEARSGYRTSTPFRNALRPSYRCWWAILKMLAIPFCVQVWICRSTGPWNPSSRRRHSLLAGVQGGNHGVWDPIPKHDTARLFQSSLAGWDPFGFYCWLRSWMTVNNATPKTERPRSPCQRNHG